MPNSKFKAFISILSLVAAGSVAFAASASSLNSARLYSIQIMGTSHAIISLDTEATGRPSCHHPILTTAYAFDISTAKGRAMLQLAQAALLANKKVHIAGGTTCTTVNATPVETLSSVTLVAQ